MMYYPMFQHLFNFPFRKEYDLKINLLTKVCNKITQNLKQCKDINENNKMVIYVSTKRPYYLTSYNINEHLVTFYQNVNAYVTNIQETENIINDYITVDTQKILCFNVPSWMHRKKSGQIFKVEVQVMPNDEN